MTDPRVLTEGRRWTIHWADDVVASRRRASISGPPIDPPGVEVVEVAAPAAEPEGRRWTLEYDEAERNFGIRVRGGPPLRPGERVEVDERLSYGGPCESLSAADRLRRDAATADRDAGRRPRNPHDALVAQAEASPTVVEAYSADAPAAEPGHPDDAIADSAPPLSLDNELRDWPAAEPEGERIACSECSDPGLPAWEGDPCAVCTTGIYRVASPAVVPAPREPDAFALEVQSIADELGEHAAIILAENGMLGPMQGDNVFARQLEELAARVAALGSAREARQEGPE